MSFASCGVRPFRAPGWPRFIWLGLLFLSATGQRPPSFGQEIPAPVRVASEASDIAATVRETALEQVNLRQQLLPEQPVVELPSEESRPPFDAASVERGRSAFESSCTTCHDAQRALSKNKSFSGWLSTVRRMAAKSGADVPPADEVPIAQYLASIRGVASATVAGEEAPPTAASLFATLSLLWRGSNGEQTLENPGFFPDAWAGAEWQPTGPLSARVTACTSCHADQNPSQGFSLEVVEASATVDLIEALGYCEPLCVGGAAVKASLTGGRFIVPFGAIATMSHPGVLRTLSLPLMFNMGRRLGDRGPLQPVLPAPFADEGVNLQVASDWDDFLSATLDVYAVNGLQGTDPSLFNSSRSYRDNNRQPSIGGRATVGNSHLRFGGSVLAGNLADDGSDPVQYHLAGGDVTARMDDRVRFYFEYAIRRDDSVFLPANVDNVTYGTVTELEIRLAREPNLGFLVRYDTLEHRHTFFGDSSLERLTYGLQFTSPRGTLFLVNHEHWQFADGSDGDVVGFRWTATF